MTSPSQMQNHTTHPTMEFLESLVMSTNFIYGVMVEVTHQCHHSWIQTFKEILNTIFSVTQL